MDRLTIRMAENEEKKKQKSDLLEVNEYQLLNPLTTQDGGCSKWGFCTKGGREYFIKEFLSPVYPNDDKLDKEILEKKIKTCKEWFENKKLLYKHISNAQNGNLVEPIKLFRCKSHFHIITQKVEGIPLNEIISIADMKAKMIMLKVLANCFDRLSKEGVIHADVKLDNIIVKPTVEGRFTVKIIDFDASYLESNPPLPDEIQGDSVYFAPETVQYMIGESVVLTPKIDVFALGIIFHQILCGEFPKFSEEYDYVYDAVLNEDNIILSDALSPDFKNLIENMLEKDPEDRFSSDLVFCALKQIENGTYNTGMNKTKIADEHFDRIVSTMATAENNKTNSRFRVASDFD